MSNKWELQTHTVNAYCYYENVFDDEMIRGIIDAGEKASIQDAYIGGDLDKPGVVDLETRKTKISWLAGIEENAWIFRKMTDVILAANQQWFNFDLTTIESLQYSVYTDGGFYDKHVDHHFQGPGQHPRKLSFTLQLDDEADYEGGSTLIHTAKEPFAIPKKKGAITLFPSYTLHEVSPVTKGTRRALVGWVLGPKWK